MAKATPAPAAIMANPTRSAKAVKPLLLCAIRDTQAKARVDPAAATNQRWRWNRLIRPHSMSFVSGIRGPSGIGKVTSVTPPRQERSGGLALGNQEGARRGMQML